MRGQSLVRQPAGPGWRQVRKSSTGKLIGKTLLALLALRMRALELGAEAVFAPRTTAELKPVSGTGGVFGCVGACGQALTGAVHTKCPMDANGPWESGTGVVCVNANNDVPNGQGTGKYGEIGLWNVSSVESMSHMFYSATAFSADISSWDVSRATTFSNAFSSAKAFRSDLSTWDVSRVTTMQQTFFEAETFTANLSAWKSRTRQNIQICMPRSAGV